MALIHRHYAAQYWSALPGVDSHFIPCLGKQTAFRRSWIPSTVSQVKGLQIVSTKRIPAWGLQELMPVKRKLFLMRWMNSLTQRSSGVGPPYIFRLHPQSPLARIAYLYSTREVQEMLILYSYTADELAPLRALFIGSTLQHGIHYFTNGEYITYSPLTPTYLLSIKQNILWRINAMILGKFFHCSRNTFFWPFLH